MSEIEDAKFLEAVENFGQEVLENNPELRDVLDKFWSGEIDTKDAIKEVWRLAAKSPGEGSYLERAMFDAFGVEPGSTDLAHFPDRERMLERWGFTEEDLIFEPFEDRPGYKMLHPLLMGMIVEVLQYDGDVPELRTGRLPEGGAPAVPVRTTARDPVVVGAMLRTASTEVAAELAEAQEAHDQKMAKMLESVGGTGAPVTGLVRQETERGVAVPGYAPGTKAQIREVGVPTASEIAMMPFKERQELAHKALTSTQGRRSAAPVIEQLIRAALTPMIVGSTLSVDRPPRDEPLVEVEWAMQIDGGVNERNPNFNFIDTAARALTNKLWRGIKDQADEGRSYVLSVRPVNEISDRRVGWTATLHVGEQR